MLVFEFMINIFEKSM